MNLVVGASGQLGTAICRLLRERGRPVRALVRASCDAARRRALADLGVEIATGDLKNAATLRTACDGVETVISTATVIASQQPGDTFEDVDIKGQRALIDAARAAGVEHFIFVSVSPNLTVSCPLIDAKRAIERYLPQVGIAYTVLQPTAFIDAWLGPVTGWDHLKHTATILGTGEQRISYIARPDVAKYAAACVDNAAVHNRTLALGGPAAVTPRYAVAVYEKLTGAAYDVQQIPVETLKARYDAAEHPVQKTFAGLMLALSGDDVIPMAATASELGVTPVSFEAYAPSLIGAAAH